MNASYGTSSNAQMVSAPPRPRAFPAAVALVLALGALLIVPSLVPQTPRAQAVAWDVLTILCALVGAGVISRSRGSEGQWRAAGALALAVFSVAVVGAIFLVIEATSDALVFEPSWYDLGFLVVAVLFLLPLRSEYQAHFEVKDRREIATDVALITAALACIAYLQIVPTDADAVTIASAAIFSLSAAAAFTGYGALALWVPGPAHVGMALVFLVLSVATLVLGNRWVDGAHVPSEAGIPLAFAVGGLVLAGLVAFLPQRETSHAGMSARYGRPVLTSIAVAAACAALASVTVAALDNRIDSTQTRVLIGLLATGIALRILVNQVRSTLARRAVRDALDQKEVALRETDKALARLQRANETLRDSEERLRLVFEAAVDGIVELDDKDVIVRANEAFSQTLELPQAMVEGQPWTSLAAAIEADETFATLPSTGQGTLMREGNAIYLEARTSLIPGDPPRRLLLVRDVTAQRVADQTIRSLFKFLQDRDEDRTRIMRRTNAAIESMRNQIARDLHDGPVQGVSAASLSLEAVLLMLRAGELSEGIEILTKVRKELAEEADNLRRLMSGLRPPLLEERGLVPALREMLEKFGRDNGMETEFSAQNVTDVPADLETLAYRVVQEALTNCVRHAKATHVRVTVSGEADALAVAVVDDGVGIRPESRKSGLGLRGIEERARDLGGTLEIHSTPGVGTSLAIRIPLPQEKSSEEVHFARIAG